MQYSFLKSRLSCLAGAQMKVGVTRTEGTGVITHIYGNHPTNPTNIVFMVKPDTGEAEVEVPEKGIIAVIEEQS